ncbi:MAG: chemotaxis protein CheW [Gemmataceae bacterium]
MTSLPTTSSGVADCWNQIGIRGDRSCPELERYVHCHNCPVYSHAGRRFLDAPSPHGYLEEWTKRLTQPIEESSGVAGSVVIFRLAEEWLALSVQVLVEVTSVRPIHRVPHRRGLLAGLVNIRGELYLCVHLDQLLGLRRGEESHIGKDGSAKNINRFLVVHREGDRWVLPVEEVDQVQRFSHHELVQVPATVSRSLAHLSQGVFHWHGRAVGMLDAERLFQTLRARVVSAETGTTQREGKR